MKNKIEKSLEARYKELQEVIDKLRMDFLNLDPDRVDSIIKKECEANKSRLNDKIKEYNTIIYIGMNGLTREQREYIMAMRSSCNYTKTQLALKAAHKGMNSTIKKSKKAASISSSLNLSLKTENDLLKKSVNNMSAERSKWMRQIKRAEAKANL